MLRPQTWENFNIFFFFFDRPKQRIVVSWKESYVFLKVWVYVQGYCLAGKASAEHDAATAKCHGDIRLFGLAFITFVPHYNFALLCSC